ncbi:uncharacterized protein LOC105685041 [Athalia rosae]|uniref:uncharacterized protein LOC105685041 n=1 Tax=Athalia rosae TaxID=37344 RepID=UPI0020342CE5|nr:uncharacterized protein LOC105685041 [Athalia rosae]
MSIIEDGFRLAGAPSECSLKSKARIDALFEDTRSVCSSMKGGWYAEMNLPAMAFTNLDEVSAEEQKRVNSAVQARIEAMFASVEAETGIPGECAAAILPVRYLGAAPIAGRVVGVGGLQEPLRDLLARLEDSLPAELEVSRRGLTFRTSESLEKINPFRRIAVWSALRLRSKELPSGELHHAFLPLVGDDSDSTNGGNKHADLYRTMEGFKKETRSSPPIFAVVMRRPGVAVRQLECHAFVCQVEEDAVAAAATLYRALLADLDANRRKPRQRNGVGCVSLASVASLTSSLSVREIQPPTRSPPGPPPPRPTAPHPVRPPRIKKVSSSSAKDDDNSNSSGAENGLGRSCEIVQVKAEDILEGRSRRSSIALNTGLPALPLGIKDKRCQPTGNRKVLHENNKNSSSRAKPTISVRKVVHEDVRNRDSQGQYDLYHNAEQKDGNFRMRSQSFSCAENNYVKMPTIRGADKSDDNNIENCGADYPVRNREDTTKSNGGRRSTSNDEEHGSIKNKGLYEVSQGQENIEPSKKTDYRYHEILIGDRNGSQRKENGFYSRKIERRSHHQNETGKRKSQEQLYKEHFRDSEKIFTLEQKNDHQNICEPRNLHNSPYEERAIEVPGSRTAASKQSIVNRSSASSPNKNMTSNVVDYSQPRPRKNSRAGSEPPRIGRIEDSAFSSTQQEMSHMKKAQSDLDLDGGDLLTRVELPRRGSFLNSSSTRKPENFQGGTPLGFTELFDEFRNQEGLTSVDDILAAIIDPEGMSFNDLKPLYKEFLLKLAATLTRDELYERSASIMRRRRRPQRSRTSRRSCLLGRAIKRSVSRLKGGPTEFTSVIFPARKLNDSLGSSSSCDARNTKNRVLASRMGRKRSSRRRTKAAIGHTTSEDSDTCRRFGRGVAANRSSSGYVSCSECSYDSESCTCISADKCYCSLSRRVSPPEVPAATIICSCDTDSCSESNKCYCPSKLPTRQPTILEQLRQRGIMPSESTLSRTGSPHIIRTLRTSKSYASSRSLEFLKVRPKGSSSDNLALDYDLFSPGKNPRSTSSNSDKVLVVGARDPQGRLIYVGGTGSGKRTPANGSGRSGAHHEALSIKKSAEIAAVFGNSTKMGRRASNASSLRSTASLEAGLGYLP